MKITTSGQERQLLQRAVAGLILIISSVGVLLPLAPAEAVGGFGGRPAYPREDNPRTESIFIHELEPNAVQEEAVKLLNNSTETKTLLVYAVDSTPSTGGAFACRQKSQTKEGVGSWVTLEEEEVIVAPGQNVIVPFVIRVPENASTGEHNGCIMIEEKKERAEGTNGVNLSFRSGMRIAITVPGELIRQLEVVDFQVIKQQNRRYLLHPSVQNTGNVSIDAEVHIATRSFFGTMFAEKGGNYPILRGETSDWNFEIEKPFWGGWFRSSLEIRYDAAEDAQIGKDTAGEQTILQGPTRWFFVIPSWKALLLYAVVLLGLAFGVRQMLQERQLRRWIAKSWVPYEVKKGETVTGIAEQRGIPWKLIVKANGLKAPYQLEAGREIQVPPRLRRAA